MTSDNEQSADKPPKPARSTTAIANRSVLDDAPTTSIRDGSGSFKSGSGAVSPISASTSNKVEKPNKRVVHRRIRSMMLTLRNVRTKKKYYQDKDVEAMKAEHVKVENRHNSDNCLVTYIQSLVFGGVDGIITSFAVVAAIAGAGYSTFYIIAIGISNLIADGLSMGFGDYLSSAGEIEFAMSELKRETWEYDNYRQGEEDEMIEIFKGRGMTTEDAELIIKTTAKYKEIFCNEMMIHELGLMPPGDDDSPVKKGLMTFIAFIICGAVPLSVYMFVDIHSQSSDYTFYISIGLTASTLFILGALKSATSYVSWYKSGFSIMFCGCVAAGAAFGISALANHFVNTVTDECASALETAEN